MIDKQAQFGCGAITLTIDGTQAAGRCVRTEGRLAHVKGERK